MQTTSDSFLQMIEDSEIQKWSVTSFQVTFFVEFFDKKFSFVILHKLAKFRCQTVLTSQVIQ